MKHVGNLALLLTAGTLASGLAIAGDDEVTRPMPDTKASASGSSRLRGEAAGSSREGADTIHRDAAGRRRSGSGHDPVYVWTNPVQIRTDRAVFVWTCRGRAEVIGTIFSSPAIGAKVITHEFHSLATTVLDVTHGGEPEEHQWKPSAPGITRCADRRRPGCGSLLRAAAHADAHPDERVHGPERGQEGTAMGARLLPQPLYRYQSTDPEVLDGAVFSFVTSAGDRSRDPPGHRGQAESGGGRSFVAVCPGSVLRPQPLGAAQGERGLQGDGHTL